MAGPEQNPGREWEDIEPPPYLQSDALKTVPDPQTYVRNRETFATNIPVINLREGLHHFEILPEIDEFLADYYKSGLARYDTLFYPTIDMSPAEGHIRERFGLNEDVQIRFSPGGSDSIFEKLGWLFPSQDFQLMVAGPAFETIVNTAKRINPECINLLTSPLNEGMAPTLKKAMYEIEHPPDGTPEKRLLFLSNPVTPTGEKLNPILMEQLAAMCAYYRVTLIVDEVLADTTPDIDSVFKLINSSPNIIGIRSGSKGLHAPEMPGYIVMPRFEAERYDNVVKPYEARINPKAMRMANYLFDPEIIVPYLSELGDQNSEIKHNLITLCEAYGIKSLPTDNRVIITAFKTDRPDYATQVEKAGLQVVDGKDFSETHPGLDGSTIRVVTPSSLELASEVALRMSEAYEAA